ncbi:MAG: nitrilase family protein [Bacteroidetes bacterium]|nr:nitrilase family protein [Bacteroidota bacterium]
MQDLKILCLQSDIVSNDPEKNRELFEIKIRNHAENHDLIILPEAFTTSFHVDPEGNSETLEGKTVAWMQQMAAKSETVITGSLFIDRDGKYFNTLIWMRPDGSFETYEKRHVFSMGGENEKISKGTQKRVVDLNGWKIAPMICYDLRFPVWSKNTLDDEGNYAYDLAIYVANWPSVRNYPWEMLLIGRAIENLAYVAGVNRVGYDTQGTLYTGDSMIIDPKGKVIERADEGKERSLSAVLSYGELIRFREKFNVGLDWDQFEIKI